MYQVRKSKARVVELTTLRHLRTQRRALEAQIATLLADVRTLEATIAHMRRWVDVRQTHEGQA